FSGEEGAARIQSDDHQADIVFFPESLRFFQIAAASQELELIFIDLYQVSPVQRLQNRIGARVVAWPEAEANVRIIRDQLSVLSRQLNSSFGCTFRRFLDQRDRAEVKNRCFFEVLGMQIFRGEACVGASNAGELRQLTIAGL